MKELKLPHIKVKIRFSNTKWVKIHLPINQPEEIAGLAVSSVFPTKSVVAVALKSEG